VEIIPALWLVVHAGTKKLLVVFGQPVSQSLLLGLLIAGPACWLLRARSPSSANVKAHKPVLIRKCRSAIGLLVGTENVGSICPSA